MIILKHFIVISLCVSILTSCVTMGPPNNIGFGRIKSVTDLEGVYINKGESSSKESNYYLSTIIWGTDNQIVHSEIKTIEVKVIDKSTILLRGMNGDVVEMESNFVEGQDFSFASGRIKLKRKLGIAGFKAGEVVVGPYYEKEDLGIDKNGNAKYATGGTIAGLVFLVLPIALSSSDEVRFIKVSK